MTPDQGQSADILDPPSSLGARPNRGASATTEGSRSGSRSKILLGVVSAAAGLLVIVAIAVLAGGVGKPAAPLIYYTLQRGDLPITVTERGNLESQFNVSVICEVDDIQGDNIPGTPILSVVPNGSSVKKGDLLVELDSSNHQERLDRQILDTEKARSTQIQAKVKYENQKTQNETTLAEAQLQLDLAELALKQFEDEDGGTFQLDLQDLELLIQEAQAGQLIEETNLEGVEQLYKLGYRSSGELAQARLSAMKSERQLATAVSKKKELVEYSYLKSKMELQGKLASAKRALLQVERDNEAFLTQAKAAMEAADEALKKEEERLARYEEQVKKCKIYAPEDGMVAYSVSRDRHRRTDVSVGAPVYMRQTILTLPSLSKMLVKTSVHESVLDQVKRNMPVTVRVDAFPDLSYKGSVSSVAVMPDQDSWLSSDTKVYKTVVTIDEDVEQLKPGMTAVIEIHVARLKDVLSVPVQAIVQIEDESWCYIGAGGSVERRVVKLGRTNDKFVEIREGLSEGDQVVLNPMAIMDEAKQSESEISPEGKSKESEEPEAIRRQEEEDFFQGERAPSGAGKALGVERRSDRKRPEGAASKRPGGGRRPSGKGPEGGSGRRPPTSF